ncbi:hypothetical protein GCM10028805_41340 [Spirosoma harenae]
MHSPVGVHESIGATKPTLVRNMPVNTSLLKESLTRTHELLDSPAFHRDSADTSQWREQFAELITLVNGVLLEAEQTCGRVDFLDDVGVNGKIQDITSLVGWMHQHLPELLNDVPGQLADNHLNRYFGQGWGYFANESFFTVDYDDELAFFIDDQRIYLNHHLRRAIDQVEQSLAGSH